MTVKCKTNRDYQRFRRSQGPSLLRTLSVETLRYARREGTPLDCALRDVLTDLRHFCDINGLDFGAIDERAHDEYLEELAWKEENAGVIGA